MRVPRQAAVEQDDEGKTEGSEEEEEEETGEAVEAAAGRLKEEILELHDGRLAELNNMYVH